MNTSTQQLDTQSTKLFEHILDELTIPLAATTVFPGMGLPEASIDVLDANLILSVTPIELPFFRRAMERVVETTHRDVIVIRAGCHPELLNPLEFDAVLNTLATPLPVLDLSLFRHFDGSLHLVPEMTGPCLNLVPGRVEIASVPPFGSRPGRRHGVEKAAAEIKRRLY